MTQNSIPDVQNRPDDRQVAIERVGIKALRHPITWTIEGTERQRTAATFAMSVALPAEKKGTHMSRFMQIANEGEFLLNESELLQQFPAMLERLHAIEGTIEIEAPLFLMKTAPASGAQSLMDYQVKFTIDGTADAAVLTRSVVVPVTTLCPCSKDISEYGAHNQRSHITIIVEDQTDIGLVDIIKAAERSASAELYGILKRTDEKVVTEQAYDNPRFVEDLIRETALAMDKLGLRQYFAEVENFESIHNHSAYAQIIKNESA